MLSSVAQEWACDQYVRNDELKLSYIEKQLPRQRLTTKNAIQNARPEQAVGKRLPSSFHGSHVNRKKKTAARHGRCRAYGPPNLNCDIYRKSDMTRSTGKPPFRSNMHGQT